VAGGEVFEARYSSARSAMLGLLFFGLVAIGLWLAGVFGEFSTDSRRMPQWMYPVVGLLNIAFAAPFGFKDLANAFSPAVSVRVDEHGMLMRDYSRDAIPWSDFTGLMSQNMSINNLLVFDVVPERRETFGPYKRFIWPFNQSMYGKGGLVTINNTDRSHRQMLQAIKAHAPARPTQYLRV
jgi:hypothetical protein